jgi:hypothetical protein
MVSKPINYVGRGMAFVAVVAAGIAAEKGLETLHGYVKKNGGYKKVAGDVVSNAKKSLDEKLQPVYEEGERICGEITDALSQCRDRFNEAWYEVYPRPGELGAGGRYEGIGSALKRPITRDRCEGCLEFVRRAQKNIPGDHPLKPVVVTDIIKTGSYDATILEGFYRDRFSWQFSDIPKLRVLMDCVQLANDYLKESPSTLHGERYS